MKNFSLYKSDAFTLHRISAHQWAEVRAFRLRALAEPGGVFGASYDVQSQESDAVWIKRVKQLTDPARAAIWFARNGDSPVGMVVGTLDVETPRKAWMLSLWCAAEARRRGVATALTQAVIAWAKTEMACDALHLHCVDGNNKARKLYEQLGFENTGNTIDHARIAGLIEHEMRRVICGD